MARPVTRKLMRKAPAAKQDTARDQLARKLTHAPARGSTPPAPAKGLGSVTTNTPDSTYTGTGVFQSRPITALSAQTPRSTPGFQTVRPKALDVAVAKQGDTTGQAMREALASQVASTGSTGQLGSLARIALIAKRRQRGRY